MKKVCTYLIFYFASAISKDIAQGLVITYKAKFLLNPHTLLTIDMDIREGGGGREFVLTLTVID